MKYQTRSQYKYAKAPSRMCNWPKYNAGLRRRGDLTIWLSEDAIRSWREPPSGRHGGQHTNADIVNEAGRNLRFDPVSFQGGRSNSPKQ